MTRLPIDSHIPQIKAAVESSRAVVVVAEPGAGKTTRVPPALVDEGRVILLQPRRIAARAVVRRIAEERGWTVGHEIGWHMRFERRFDAATQLLAATEGILTARLQQDPLLSDFRTVVFDEFHERSIYADVAIALAKQAWLARPDLRIVVMSATIDATGISRYFDACPIVNVPGRLFSLDVRYAPGMGAADASLELLEPAGGGHRSVLVFMPGMVEIRRTIADIDARVRDAARAGVAALDVLPLHGSLDAADQDRVLRPAPPDRRRIIVSTNVAETSLTVPDVTAVVDSGLHKVARYDANRAIDSLETERITQDAADQRAGRAARIAPGTAIRLWDARDRLRPHRDADIHRIDLAAAVLDVLAWGGDPETLDWFERPADGAIGAAMRLLERIGAVDRHAITPLGRQLQALPTHPRLARILIEGRGARTLAQACALITERHFIPARSHSTASDLLSAIDDWRSVPPHVQRVADELERTASAAMTSLRQGSGAPPEIPGRRGESAARALPEDAFRKAILAGYPDRVAARREPGSARVKLATGAGAVVAPESGVRDGEFLIAVDVHDPDAGRPSKAGVASEARIRIASRIEREWLQPTTIETVHRFDRESGTVRAAHVEGYDALVLRETPAAADRHVAAPMLAQEWLAGGLSAGDVQLERRVRFASVPLDLHEAARRAAEGAASISDITLARGLDKSVLHALDRDAPATLAVPSGRTVPLEYREDGSVTAAVKLQELFGLAETPRIGKRREPVVFSLLAPNGRPVQTTRDLRSFWERTYPDVRKELRGRYPKHPWPEDPWNAEPTARPRRRAQGRQAR